MAKDTYGTVVGFVQFDPNVREHNGMTLTDVVIQSATTGENIRLTVWPEFDVELEKGDYVAAQGKVSTRTYKDKTGQDKTSKNLSVTNIFVGAPVEKASGSSEPF